jgi:hypothetical protein
MHLQNYCHSFTNCKYAWTSNFVHLLLKCGQFPPNSRVSTILRQTAVANQVQKILQFDVPFVFFHFTRVCMIFVIFFTTSS